LKKKTLVWLFGAVCICSVFTFCNKPAKPNPVPRVISEKTEIPPVSVYNDPNPYTHQLLLEYNDFIERAIGNGLAPGAAVAIIKDSSVIFLKGFGLKDIKKKDSINTTTVFRIASVSKCFAAVLTGILVDNNILTLNDQVVQYLPEFKLRTVSQTNGLTLRHVLSHTIGLPRHSFTDRVDAGVNFDTLVYHLRDLPLLGKPGQYYSYQNVGFSLIGDVIQAATGKSYAENLQSLVFDKLNMSSASVTYDSIMRNGNVAKPHHFRKGWRSAPISSTYYNVGPAGGINASISDMARWLIALTQEDGLLKPATKKELFTPVVKAVPRNNNFWKWKPVKSAHYALGWRVINFKTDTLLYHGGYVNGYRSEVAINQKERIAICVLVNSPGHLADLSIPKFFELYTSKEKDIKEWGTFSVAIK
jgi:beta-lactamase class C